MNPWRGLGGLPKEVWLLFITTLVNRSGTMALPFLALYLTQDQGLPAARAGLALTFYGIGALITAPLAGRLCDYIGALRVMKLSLLLSGAVLLVFPLAHSYVAILAATLIWAIVSEAFRPASLTITTDLVAPEQRKAAFALSRLAINIGMSIGPAVGGFLALLSFPALFFVDGGTSIIAGLILFTSSWQVRPHAQSTEPSAAGAINNPSVASRTFLQSSALSDRRFLRFFFALIPVLMVFFQTQAAMPLFMVQELKISPSIYGVLFAINTVLIILLEIPLNMAMAHWSHRRALAIGALLCGIGFGALALAQGIIGVAATIVVWTFGEMILFPSTAAYMADIAPAERRGEYMGFYQMSFSLAFAIGPWVGTEILERFSSQALWITCLISCSLAAMAMAKLSLKPALQAERRASA